MRLSEPQQEACARHVASLVRPFEHGLVQLGGAMEREPIERFVHGTNHALPTLAGEAIERRVGPRALRSLARDAARDPIAELLPPSLAKLCEQRVRDPRVVGHVGDRALTTGRIQCPTASLDSADATLSG